MTSTLKLPTRMTFGEFLAFEETASVRHELMDGVLYSMSGGADVHHLICTNLVLGIAGPLLGHGQVFQGGMTLRVDHQNADSDGYYPDLMVSCTATDRERLFRREPILLVEVSSPSTDRIDRGEKRLNDLQIPSLLEYALAAQDKPKVEIVRRRSSWGLEELYPGDTLVLDSAGLRLPLSDIYPTITFRVHISAFASREEQTR